MTTQLPSHRLTTLSGHNGPVHALTYSAGLSQYILTGSADRTIRLFNPAHSRLVQSYHAHGYEVLSIAVSSDNARFASVGGDKTVFLWDVATAQTLRRFTGHAGRVNAVDFGGEEDSVVVSGSYDGTVRLWDTKSGSYKPIMVLDEARDSVSCLCVRGEEVAVGSIDGRIRVYDVRMGSVATDVIGYPVTSITPTKRNDSFLISTLDSKLRLMDKSDGRLLQSFSAPEFVNTNYRLRSALAMNDSIAISGSENGCILAWDVLSGSVTRKLYHSAAKKEGIGEATKKDVVSAVAVCPARKEWASAGGDGNVVIWGVQGS